MEQIKRNAGGWELEKGKTSFKKLFWLPAPICNLHVPTLYNPQACSMKWLGNLNSSQGRGNYRITIKYRNRWKC